MVKVHQIHIVDQILDYCQHFNRMRKDREAHCADAAQEAAQVCRELGWIIEYHNMLIESAEYLLFENMKESIVMMKMIYNSLTKNQQAMLYDFISIKEHKELAAFIAEL